MPSVLELIHLPSRSSGDRTGIDDLAREAELSGRGAMNKAEKIIALADEELPEKARKIVRASSKDLIRRARKTGVEGYSKFTKSELQERFLKALLAEERSTKQQASKDEGPPHKGRIDTNGAASDGIGRTQTTPRSRTAGAETSGPSPTRSHFDSDEQRSRAIREAAHQALDTALEEKRSYVVVESFRASDKTQPLSIQPAYMQRHEDTLPVCEILIPHLAHRT